ncbi:hypothetical protein [Micromonospora sp. NPDC049679]|uniref:hypothetical protein n=1 Tax=Micromonospora sp. NPDC049679 TaxID=3155920 RepID=UPI0033FC4CDF
MSSALAAPQPASADPHTVSLTINSSGQLSPNYRLELRNSTTKPIDVTVRQELPRGTGVTTTSSGGRVGETEVTWQVQAPPRSTTALTTSLTQSGGVTPLLSPACAYENGGNRPYDCSAASWTPPPPIVPANARVWWQQPRNLTIAGLSLLFGVVLIWSFARSLRRRRRRAAGRPPIGPTTRNPARALAPPPAPRRRRPPAFLVFALGIVLLAAGSAIGTQATVLGAHATGIVGKQRNGGWIGEPAAGPVGAVLHEAAFEVTVYRIACQESGRAARRCLATIGLHNVSNNKQLWYAPLQRAYLPTGNWVSTDEAATREVNGGRDFFAEPVASGQRLLFPLVFTVTSDLLPNRIELRSGVFNAGVTVTSV